MTTLPVHDARTIFACALGLSVSTIPLIFGSFGILMTPLAIEFGWSRGTIGLALTSYVIGVILSSPIVGRLVDRRGAKPIILVSTALLGIALVVASQLIQSPASLYATYFAIAILGAGASPVTYSKIITSQFDKRRGLALGLALSGVGIGTALIPVIGQMIIADSGWPKLFWVFGILILLVILPLLMLGLPKVPVDKLIAQRPDNSFGEVFRNPQFRKMTIVFLLVGIGYTGMATQLIPLMIDKHLSPPKAAAMQGLLGLSVIGGRLISGALLDHIAPRLVAGCAISATAMGVGLLIYTPVGTWTYFGIFLLGLSAGAEVDVMAYMTARYFDMARYGFIYGTLNSAYFIGTAIGPVAAAASFDRFGNYDTAGVALIAALLLGLAAVFLIKDPKVEG
jgi:MFS family permease